MLLNRPKIITIFSSILILFAAKINAAPVNKIHELTLENGMQVFLLEDFTDACVHIEYACRAGFSSQTQSNCGFFKLYSRMIQSANPELQFTEVQCNADSSRYFIDASPAELEQVLAKLSQAAFSPDFSDEVLSKELSALKKEVSENANTMSVYINAAIDSRVFSDAPWKHDSGIYPPFFKKTTEKTARTTIKQISEQWYTPKNSAIFISGNITQQKALLMLKNTFGRYYSNFKTPVAKPAVPVNRQRKYVLHSPEISSELTQMVIQYTMLDMEQADLMALALGYEGSIFKQQVLSFEELNIPGDEYVNVSAAHKKDSSRLIIQTLLQPPENKKLAASTNSYKQSQLFLKQINLIPQLVRQEEFEYAKNQLEYSLNRTTAESASLMQNLSSFWAVQPYIQPNENDSENFDSPTAAAMMERNQKLKEKSLAENLNLMSNEEPFIFIILNSKDYKTYKKSYTQAGFEEINEKNASWYVQSMFKAMKEEKENETPLYAVSQDEDDNSYYQRNLDSIGNFTLSNGIQVTTKTNPLSTQTTLVLSIKGGKYNSADDNGFEEVMINLLAGLIQKNLRNTQEKGLLTGAFNVSSETALSRGLVIIEFDTEDTVAVCKTLSQAIVYGEIAPADADRAVSGRKYRKRLENGTAANQMYSTLIQKLYGKGKIASVFDAEKEILLDTDYTKILSAYPALLDASRYSLIVTGALHESLQQQLEESLGILANFSDNNDSSENIIIPDLSSAKNLRTRIRHTFLTDIPAEKAGPMPAVLIPTKEFLDPVIFAGIAPQEMTKQAALYNAVLSYISTKLSDYYDNTIQFPRNKIRLSSITVQNVSRTRELDAQYKTIIQKIKKDLETLNKNEKTMREIKNNWIQTQMKETGSDTGTALLLNKGLELSGDAQKTSWYLEEYNLIQNATIQDFLEIMEYFPAVPEARIYSADSKK